MKSSAYSIFAAALLILTGLLNPVQADTPTKTPPVDFAREVLPILSNKCFVCHGPDTAEEDLVRLDSFEAATNDLGGYHAINPAQPEASELLIRIVSTDDPMPPADAEKQLTADERDVLSRWVREGGDYAEHWAFVPPQKAKPNRDATEPSDVIDAFVQQRLETKQLTFAPAADRGTLARRAALVLTGLPPTPDALAAFLADTSDSAYETFVDTLLASDNFGEHQARYWLDAVRYGDTHGLHLDNRRAIYPYRDWVVHALNRNLPLDDFITWQLAGDLLPNPTLEQRVATGFVRMNPTTAEGGVIPAEFQAKNNFDRVEMLGTVMLGVTMTCARCHTHKYDPIPQTEYYRLLAFFNSTSEDPLDSNKYDYAPVLKAPENQSQWAAWDQTQQQLDRTRSELVASEASANSHERQTLTAQLEAAAKQLSLFEASFTAKTLVTTDLEKPRETRLLSRGEYNLPVGDVLEPGTLSAMGEFPADAPRNRLGLARWLTARDHPLTSRVLVNRIWQRTFGEGLVRTPEDFGSQGQQPTHPELLDWLAVELHESGWDLKHLLRAMVTSRTFGQNSAWRSEFDDPENRLLARGPSHRLDAEVIRDIALWSSGLLDPHRGGEGVKPYQPAGLWSALSHPVSNTKLYVADKGEKLFRRSLYVYWKRTSPHPIMTLFDAPSRETSCVRRSRTNTSLQSLGLLNETQRIEMARSLAARLLRQADDDTARLEHLFTLLACRQPTDTERKTCLTFIERMRKRYAENEADALALLTTGDAPRDESFPAAEQAAWAQLAITVLASDLTIMLY